jgi:hypothetical protein
MALRARVLGILLAGVGAISHAQTTISLVLNSASVAQGTVIVATASVASSGTPLTVGVVDFYDGAKLAASVQVVGTSSAGYVPGTAVLRKAFAPGTHSVKAVYRGTSTYPSATSSVATLSVSGGPIVDGGLQYGGTVDMARSSVYDFVSDLTVADTNQDGVPDILALQFDESEAVLTSANPLQPGVFGAPSYIGAGTGLTEAEQIRTVDLNGDGLLDVVFTASDAGEIRIYPATGPGTFGTVTILSSNAYGVMYPQIAIADFNHDGLPDIAAVGSPSTGGSSAAIWFNDPAHPGTFLSAKVSTVTTLAPFTVSTGDMNGDGLPDLVVSDVSSKVAVALSDPTSPGLKWNTTIYDLGSAFWHTSIADLNKDGVPDLIAGAYSGSLLIALGDPTHPGSLLPTQAYAPPSSMAGVAIAGIGVGDIDGDGNTDIVAANTSKHFTVFQGNGTGTFTAGPAQPVSPTAIVFNSTAAAWENSGIAVTDLDGDGLDDVVFAELRQDTAQIFRHLVVPGALIQTSTDISVNATVVHQGQPIIVTATEQSTTGTMTGVVEFYDFAGPVNGPPLGTASIIGGIAVYTVLNASVGSHDYAEKFAGDSVFAPSQSGILQVIVLASPSATVALTSSPNPSTLGQSVTFRATLTPSSSTFTPSGTVTFFDGSTSLGSGPLAAGIAVFNISTLITGSHTITAVYNGDTNFPASTSNPVIQIVGDQSLTTLAANPTTAAPFSPIQFTASVTAASGNPTIPTGTVSFFAGNTFLASANLNAAGVATVVNASLAAGIYQVTARYAGDTLFSASISAAVTITINITASPTNTTLTVNPNPGVQGRTESLHAQVLTASSGTVDFYDGGALIAASAVDATGAASAQASFLVGTHTLTAIFRGNTQSLGSTSAPVTLIISARDYAVSTSAPSLTIATEHHAPITVTVQSIGGFADGVHLSCGSLPPYASCTFSQSTLHIPAGGSASTQVMVDTDLLLNYASTSGRSNPLLCLLPLAVFLFPKARQRPRNLLSILALFALAAASGCSGKLPGHTEPGSYSVTILAHASTTAIDHTAAWTLVVTPK